MSEVAYPCRWHDEGCGVSFDSPNHRNHHSDNCGYKPKVLVEWSEMKADPEFHYFTVRSEVLESRAPWTVLFLLYSSEATVLRAPTHEDKFYVLRSQSTVYFKLWNDHGVSVIAECPAYATVIKQTQVYLRGQDLGPRYIALELAASELSDAACNQESIGEDPARWREALFEIKGMMEEIVSKGKGQA